MQQYYLILKNPGDRPLPDWAKVASIHIDSGDAFVRVLIYGFERDEAIAALTALGFEVWAEEWKQGEWVSRKL